MTIKWVKSDPLVMNGEPFCYGTRLTVRNLLEMRASGMTPDEMIGQNPELRRVGIAEAYAFAGTSRARYADFLDAGRQPHRPRLQRRGGSEPARPPAGRGRHRRDQGEPVPVAVRR